MAPPKYIFNFTIIIILYFISASCSLEDDVQPNNDIFLYDHDRDGYYDQETGYDSRAYPSQFLNSVGKYSDGMSSDLTEVGIGIESYLEKLAADTSAKTVSVQSYGAKGDGKSDDTKAFEKAWEEACSSSGAVFLIPKNKKYLVKQITFEGPCKTGLTVQIAGTILASDNRGDYKEDKRHWLMFENIKNLVVGGGGVIDGNGKIWWENSCKIDKSKPCTDAPTALTFYRVKKLTVKDLQIQNAQQIQVSFERCVNVDASDLRVTAPGDSPNTDGVHITRTENMQLSSSVIKTGDDCVSIEDGTKKLKITDLTCGPGHGISIGSLGDDKSEAHVSDVTVNGAKLSGTTNGVRIKTYQGGSGSASNIKFKNIDMKNVKNPIIIDQNYCDQAEPCKQQKSAVQVKNVVYENIKGTSATDVAINFDCSEKHPCQDIVLKDIKLTGKDGDKVKAVCNNVEVEESGTVSPRCPNN
ncbi:Endo-polygalacturonidase [Heracleum sosnowskyi]|uniref:endo-polygalacturonase n=1 Tax=Heracleum sosnowskyi TaxID=360622 RepID=A0AAD8J7Z9_9APIA|nr:Endo-polygalacturonidase [Heracleum sosnowskyi]